MSVTLFNDRWIDHAIEHGDVESCKQMLANGIAAASDVSACKQASRFRAAINAPCNQSELLALLLGAGYDANSIDDSGSDQYQYTALTCAARLGRLDLIEQLVMAAADIHWRSPTGANMASESLPCWSLPISPGLNAVRNWLAERDVRIDPHSDDSWTKMCRAARWPKSWPDVVMLQELGIDASGLGWSPLMHRIASGVATISDVDQALAAELEATDCRERTAFHLAVQASRLDLAKALIARGLDMRARGWVGSTALHLAAENNCVKIVEWLVASGLQVDVLNDQHHTPLVDAVSNDHQAAALCLLRLGADVNATDDIDYRAIHWARSLGMLSVLLRAGASVNDISGGGEWPLKEACLSGDADVVNFLLEQGADPNLTSTGETALFSAVQADSIECVNVLLAAGAEINAQDGDGWTCLFCLNSVPMAKLLLSRGVDPSITDEVGGLPEKWASPAAASQCLRDHRLFASDSTNSEN